MINRVHEYINLELNHDIKKLLILVVIIIIVYMRLFYIYLIVMIIWCNFRYLQSIYYKELLSNIAYDWSVVYAK
jgi:hypothetical protein